MKATGIVRRIDDLGRVVIPKEIRRTMRIREGDPLEIYTNPDGEVIFKKYSPINELSDGALQAAEVISKLGGAPAVIFDKDHVVAVSGAPKKEYSQRRISPALEEMLESRKNYEYTDTAERVRPVEGLTACALTISPIISNGDISGAVAFMAADDSQHVSENQSMLCKAAAMFLGKQIEE
ncbi:stage V sporulation T C-terminal domain-containing protein [uncultured Ruminococcus sp.]|uniref:stage V sporulation T C-terminal domain-containing protein n=1 Tax=uncultured Ruminococcus sp. TaxID=165186 RepID=UPI0025F3EA12|nr:stage V sporulation T C-terminal domain-containing protein [uncultured Ruminococcus sp.]